MGRDNANRGLMRFIKGVDGCIGYYSVIIETLGNLRLVVTAKQQTQQNKYVIYISVKDADQKVCKRFHYSFLVRSQCF